MYYNLIPLMSKAPPFLPAAQTYFDQVVTNGGSLTANEKTYINTFIGALGTDFAEFDRLWIHGLSNSVAARTSLVNPTSTMITAVNSPTFTANQGYNGNGTNSYLNTNYNPTTQGVKFTRNSASLGFYCLTNSDIAAIDMGHYNTCFTQIRTRQGNEFYGNVNDLAGSSSRFPNLDSRSLHVALRPNNTLVNGYKLGLLISSAGITSVPLNNNNIFILARNTIGTADTFSSRKLSASFTGSGIINQLNLYNAVQALGTSIGWAV